MVCIETAVDPILSCDLDRRSCAVESVRISPTPQQNTPPTPQTPPRMNFTTCFAVVLAAVIAVSVSADDELKYCIPTEENGCPPLYSETNAQVSLTCRNILDNQGGNFAEHCITECGKLPK